MYVSITTRAAIRATLPFQSDYPACAFGAARTDYAKARRIELESLRAARTVTGTTYATFIGDTRRYLANLRAARQALRAIEAR